MRDLASLVAGFHGVDVLVVGESFLDGWWFGTSKRLCREAPVPVVDAGDCDYVPGAAANTAANVASLGARVRFLSVVGDDDDGRLVRRALRDRGVHDDDVLIEPGRRTVAKRRVLAGGQLVTRVDTGDTRDVAPQTARRLVDRLIALAPSVQVVLCCDYDGGVFTDAVRAHLADLQARAPRLVVVDARDLRRWTSVRPTVVTPNAGEVQALLPTRGALRHDRPHAVSEAGERILDAAGSTAAVVTLDTDGAVVLERGRPAYRLYTEPVPDSQAAGAGDSFAAALAVGLALGVDCAVAAELGSAAASVVVRRPGTTVCTRAELYAEVTRGDRGALALNVVAARVAAHRDAGRRIVLTNGCFDVLHRGHVAYLNAAKALGDVLVVAVNSDDSVRRLKGPDRPVNGHDDRAAVLAALSCVDLITVFDGDTADEVITAVRPDVYVKGGDYTPAMLPEAPLVERLGGEVHIVDYLEDRSTSGLLERIRAGASS